MRQRQGGGSSESFSAPYIPTMHAITTIEANFYWNAVVNGYSRYGFRPVTSLTGGKAIRNGMRITNTTPATTTITVPVTSLASGSLASTLSIPVEITSLANLTGKTIHVTCVGDSLTNSGDPANRMATLATTNGFTIVGYGTQGATNKHEGRSGWTWSNFNNGLGTSPFYNGGILDWENYFTAAGGTPEVVSWALGTNDVFSASSKATLNEVIADANAKAITAAGHAETLINGLRSYDGRIANLILMPGPGSSGPTGFGVNYGLTNTEHFYHAAVMEYRRVFASYFSSRVSEGIFVAELGAMIDPEYGASLASTAVSAYNAATVTESNNGVHFGTAGYVEMAASMLASVSYSYINKPEFRILTFGRTVPYARTWEYLGSTLTEYTGSTFAPVSIPGDYQSDAKNGLAVTCESNSKTGILNSSWNWIQNTQTLPSHSSVTSSSVHPSGNYLAMVGINAPYIYMFSRSIVDGSLSLIDPGITMSVAINRGCAFSNDGTRLAIGGGVDPTLIYTFTDGVLSNPVTLPGPTNTIVSFSWRYDDSAIAYGYGHSPYVAVHKRTGDSYEQVTAPAAAGSAWCRNVHFSPDGTKVAAVHNNSTSLTWYDYDGNSLVARTNPVSMPGGNGYGVQWIDNKRLVVGSSGAPYLTTYTVTGGLLVNDPAVVPSTALADSVSTIRRFQ
jgi:lysophospholipase L1-like esterase